MTNENKNTEELVLPTLEQINDIMAEGLASDFPEDSVEMGENWGIIALIFFEAGFRSRDKK